MLCLKAVIFGTAILFSLDMMAVALDKLYYQVVTGRGELGGCRLGEEIPLPTIVNPLIFCGSLCNLETDCHTFCISLGGTDCILTSFLITTHVTSSGNPQFDSCYTSWHKQNDVSRLGIATSPFPQFIPNENKALNAIKGTLCNGMKHICFATDFADHPYWHLDLQQFYEISRIKIAMNRQPKGLTAFENVEIRVGGTALVGGNPVFAIYQGPASRAEILDFQPSTPMLGQFVVVQAMSTNTSLSFCEVQILVN